jgi:CHAT domain-containing protein/tetratricopeptide (TPR) repeat protein
MKKLPQMSAKRILFLSAIALITLLFLIRVHHKRSSDLSGLKKQEFWLAFGKAVKQNLPNSTVHSYQVTIDAAQYLRFAINLGNTSLSIKMYSPAGMKLSEFNLIQAKPREFSLITEAAGAYRIEVCSLEKEPSSGFYELSIRELRPFATQDNSRLAAEKLFAEGEFLTAQGNQSQLRQAIDKYKEALNLWNSIGDKNKEANTLRTMGETYFLLREFPETKKLFDSALQLSDRYNDPTSKGEILNSFANVLAFQGNPRQAYDYGNQALEISRRLNDKRIEAYALYNLGLVDYFRGDKRKSIETHYVVLSICQLLGDRQGQARALERLGLSHSDLSEIQKADDCLQQALSLWRTLNDQREQAWMLTAMARLYSKLDRKQDALNLYNKAKDLLQPMGDKIGEAMILNGLGYLYYELGEKEAALDYYTQAFQLYRDARIRNGEGGQLLKIGEIHLSIGNKPKALDCYKEALSIIREVEDRRLESSALRYLGMAYESLGQKNQALTYYNRALNIINQLGDNRQKAYLLNNIGQVYEILGLKQKALRYYNQALPLNQTTQDRLGESSTLYNIAELERSRGNLASARVHIERSLNLIESSRLKINSQGLRTSYFASIHEQYEFYIGLLMHLSKQQSSENLPALALEASERVHARGLMELLSESHVNIRQGVSAELLELERSLQRQLTDKADEQTRLLSGKHTKEQETDLAQEIQDLTVEFDQVKARIKSESPRFAELTHPQPVRASKIQEMLDHETLLLEYLLGEKQSYAWVVTSEEIIGFELPRRAEIEKLARELYEVLAPDENAPIQLERQRTELFANRATELSRKILSPMAARLDRKRLVIIADGFLQHIPFSVLPKPATDKANERRISSDNLSSASPMVPLIQDHEVSNLPSASTLAVLREETGRRKAAPKTIAVLADPVFEANDLRLIAIRNQTNGITSSWSTIGDLASHLRNQPLPQGGNYKRLRGTSKEASAIETLTTPNDRFVARGFEASRKQATSPELSQYRIIHFATHGALNDKNPELSALVFSLFDRQGKPQEGYLLLHEIYNLKLQAELVVLSACDTGLGKEFKGEGLVGLTRGFMYAGSPRVIASLWKVDDEPTARLMQRFYWHLLKEGSSPAAALRQAKLDLLHSSDWSAPFYWGSFVLQGEWQ